MRALMFAIALTSVSAAAAWPASADPPTKTIQCIDVGGQTIPALCSVPSSRLDAREYICTCPEGGQRVEVAICAKGQRPPPESRALNTVRRKAARDGSLLGDQMAGRPICVAPRTA